VTPQRKRWLAAIATALPFGVAIPILGGWGYLVAAFGLGALVMAAAHAVWPDEEHGDALPQGTRLPYRNGEFVASCLCGRTFGSTQHGDEDTADYLLSIHLGDAALTDDQLLEEMRWG
jgi:hypothetical protein